MSNLQQQINQLKDELSAGLEKLQRLEEQVKNEPKHKNGWFDTNGDDKCYFYIEYNGKIHKSRYSKSEDELIEANNNMFSSQELAEEVAYEGFVYRIIRRWRDTHDTEFNNAKDRYYIDWDIEEKELVVGMCCYYKYVNMVYFSTEELAEQCIEKNRELLTKYFNR